MNAKTGRERLRRLKGMVVAFLLLVRLVPINSLHAQPTPPPPALDQTITPIPPAPIADPRKIALGKKLFYDPQLSASGHRACSSCHDVSSNGADGRRFDVGLKGKPIHVNTSTVFNAALNYRMNWEGNARTLEDEASVALSDPQLMGSSAAGAALAAKSDLELRHQFRAIYGHSPDSASLLDAIANFERSLVTPDCRFDLWLKGDKTALSSEELQGYMLFASFGCVSCHQGVNVGGNLFERSGVFHPIGSSQALTLLVPSLRNIAVTAPYFHDGSASSLRQAVLDMGYAQLDRRLSDDQVDAVAAFLSSLTGRYQGHLLSPPPS